MRKFVVNFRCELSKKDEIIEGEYDKELYDTYAVVEVFELAEEYGINVEEVLSIQDCRNNVNGDESVECYVDSVVLLCGASKYVTVVEVKDEDLIAEFNSRGIFVDVTAHIGKYHDKKVFMIDNENNKVILETIEKIKTKDK